MKERWEKKKLGEICHIYQPKTITKKEMSPAGRYPVFGANGIIGKYKEYNHEDPQLLITCRGATCGSINLSLPRSWITGNAMVVRPKTDEINLQFLKYFCHYGIDFSKVITGAAQPQITRVSLSTVMVFYPPLPKQKRIVAILDEVFAGIDAALANTEKNLANVRELFACYVQAVLNQPWAEWEKKKLGDVCKFVRGPFGSSLKKSNFVPYGYAVYEQQHAINNQFHSIRYFIDDQKFKEMQRFEIFPGDIIMSCSGTMGKVAIVPHGVKRGIINQALLKLKPAPYLDAVFLKLWMESKGFLKQIEKYSKGAAIKNVSSVRLLKEINIPLPPLPEQKRIVAQLDELSAASKRLEALYKQKQKALEELKQALLHKAFSGDLTAQPEPLEQITTA